MYIRINRRYFRFMRNDAPPLMPIFRSRVQGEVLAETLLHPDDEMTVSELARRIAAPVSTVHDEVQRLVAAGILVARPVGQARVVRANTAARAVTPLTDLVAVTFGAATVVREEFGSLPKTERVMVFGSWAARLLGEEGPPPNDVDVLVVGTPPRTDVYAAADRAEDRLRMHVNPVIRSPQRFAARDEPLVQQILHAPHVTVIGGDA